MSAANWLQFLALVGALLVTTPLLGAYLARVLGGGTAPGDRVFLRSSGSSTGSAASTRTASSAGPSTRSVLAFSVVCVLGLYVLQRLQGSLPLNPTDLGAVTPALAFNTAVSFVTNTNWQNYSGESTMSHLTQMAGLAVQNFVSAAVGLAVAVALDPRPRPARARHDRQLLGRPARAARCASCCRSRSCSRSCSSSQGVVQNFDGHAQADAPVEGATQMIPGGPVASQEAIKELGTNGGGFYNANSAHPFENPNGVHEHPRDLRAPR